MNLDRHFFKREYKYKNDFINKCILVIKFSKDEKRVRGYKNFVFRMMKPVVRKNMYNFLSLLKSTSISELPECDEIITESYIIFDKCIEKYIVKKTNNFYFYFNKSLSRNFFRNYQKEIRMSSTELTDVISVTHPSLRNSDNSISVEIIYRNLNFSELEIRVANSKMNGQKIYEFLEENSDFNNVLYTKCLKEVKRKLQENKREFL